jgi:hypothetical protein
MKSMLSFMISDHMAHVCYLNGVVVYSWHVGLFCLWIFLWCKHANRSLFCKLWHIFLGSLFDLFPICVIPFQVMFSWFRCFQTVKPGMPFGESEACKACTSTYWMWWYMHFILFFFLFAFWEHYSWKTCHDRLNTHVNKTHAITGEMLPGISIHKKQLILQ